MNQRQAWGFLIVLAAAAAPARAVEQVDIDRAIAKGVRALRAMQQADGTWPHSQIGATALAGLTLLECGAAKDDKDVLRAADAVRKASVSLAHTYSISLSLMFLDRLGDREDEPFIKALAERLLAGQDGGSGGWSYGCPPISTEEQKSLQEKLNGRKDIAARQQAREQQRGTPGFPQVPQMPGGDFAMIMAGPGDNSNTQFATLGVWVARRHGISVDLALTRLNKRFRQTQMEDGGWTYSPMMQMPGIPAHAMMPFGMGSTAAMTCAGILALAICDGATLDLFRQKKPDAKLPDISKDVELNKGLQALGAVIDNPKGLQNDRPFAPPGVPMAPFARVGGRTYYFLWSLERVAVALDLKTIGRKDWYGWGAEILLDNQLPDGSWSGDYGTGGVDTCFALLFLRRANLIADLTKSLKGKIVDPGERVLRAGRQRIRKKMTSGIESKDAQSVEKPLPAGKATASNPLTDAVLKATGPRRAELLEKLENEKGAKYTEALAAAIPKLQGEERRKARQALADRLTRMKDDTLVEYLRDEDAEIRRAAALAVGQKDSKALLPDLIALLRDPEPDVIAAAHASLKEMTGQDFGPNAKATREEREQAVLKWIAWWSKNRKKN